MLYSCLKQTKRFMLIKSFDQENCINLLVSQFLCEFIVSTILQIRQIIFEKAINLFLQQLINT